MEPLHSTIRPIAHLTSDSIHAMYRLFAQYYDSINLDAFQSDLSKKSHVLQIHNADQVLVGFTSILHFEIEVQQQTLQIVYSGDTIMADTYWGNPILAFAWLKFAGTIKARNPSHPLYWFIIVKGHRTYRYLPVFSKIFYPNYQYATPSWEQNLIDHLATMTFGDNYDSNKGIVHFQHSQGHLKESWAAIPKHLLQRKEIQFFMSKNPDYHRGDELVCLCKLDEHNLKPLSRRLFNEGYLQHNEQHAVV